MYAINENLCKVLACVFIHKPALSGFSSLLLYHVVFPPHMLIVVYAVDEDVKVCVWRQGAALHLQGVLVDPVDDRHWGVQPDGLLDALRGEGHVG